MSAKILSIKSIWSTLSACQLSLLTLFLTQLLFAIILNPEVNGIIVDGTKKGPSALKNQSHEEDMIDGYNTKTCGIADPENKSQFVNAAKEGMFPWLVSFQVIKGEKDAQKRAHFCMGSFISDKWILSAAHCFADPNLKPFLEKSNVFATGGTTNAYSPDNSNFTIKKIFYHAMFDRKSPIGFDISLVEIEDRAKIKTELNKGRPFVNTVCLPIEGKEFKAGQAVKIAGWGDTESKDPNSKPDNLLTTDLVITDGEKCAEIFSKKLKKVEDQYHKYKDFICADYHGERDACQGDSGGSLLEYADGKAVCVGIVSYGLGCATKGVPGVYSKTSSFMPWIKDITQNREKAKVKYILLEPGKK